MKPVKKLPSEVCSVVRSGVVIPTPAQAVVELVLNSIDGGASSIAVRVDLRLFKIQVIDNGIGISLSDLETIGNRSVTSKCYTLDEYYNNLMYHGFRGEALASLREMCGLMDISTRPTDDNNTYGKLFIHGKEENVKVSELKRPSHGTTVTLTDFMFNMPVRRARMKEAVELEAIRSCIECIALAHPEISLSVRNDSKGRVILEKHKSSDILSAFEHLFGHNLARTLASINYSTEKFKISGFISKEAYRHNDLQFIYVNRQPIVKTKLHKLVNALLSKSSIIRTNGPWKKKPIPRNVPPERWISFPALEKQRKFGVFVINIVCARKEYEMCWDSKKPLIYFQDWEGILSCFSESVQQFLRKENLVDDDEEEENEKGSRKANISQIVKSDNFHDSFSGNFSSEDNPGMEFETWDIQGAVHGIVAKRPKEMQTHVQQTSLHVESSSNQVESDFVTPCMVTKKESLSVVCDSIPPVVKFLGKYETPPAARLKITKGAYRLKIMEEEAKKKLKVANKLEHFKFSSKPKLISLKNSQNEEKRKSLSLKIANEKLKKRSDKNVTIVEKEKYFISKNQNKHVVTNPSSTSSLNTEKDVLPCFDNESFDSSFVIEQCENDNTKEDLLSREFEHVSNSSLDSYDCIRNNRLNSTSSVSNSCNENILPPAEERKHAQKRRDGTSRHSLSFLDLENKKNVNANDINKFSIKSANTHEYSLHSGKNPDDTYSAYDERIVFSKHANLNLNQQFLPDKRGGCLPVNINSKQRNLCFSKVTVISIPTPQCNSAPKHTALPTSLKGKSVHSGKASVTDDTNVGKPNKHNYSTAALTSDERSDNFLLTKYIAAEEKKLDEWDKNGVECDVFKRNSVKPFFQCSKTFTDINEKSKEEQLPYSSCEFHKGISFSFQNESSLDEEINGYDNGVGKNAHNAKNVDLHEESFTLSPQKVINHRNTFETFESNLRNVCHLLESRSPYFTIKANSDYYDSTQMSLKSKQVSNDVMNGNMQCSSSHNFKAMNKNTEEAVESLVYNMNTKSQKEIFSCTLNNDKTMERETSRKPLINFSFPDSSSSPVGSEIMTKQIMDAEYSPVFNLLLPVSLSRDASKTQKFLSPLQVLEELNEEIDVPKRRRTDKETTSNNEQATMHQISNEEKQFMSSCHAIPKNNIDVCEENNSIMQKQITATISEHTETQNLSDRGEQSVSSCPVIAAAENRKKSGICEEDNSIKQNESMCNKETVESLSDTQEKDWMQLKNLEGKLFYFHVPSGFTSYNAPISKNSMSYTMSKRLEFLPKGMSPLLALSSSHHDDCWLPSDSNGTSSKLLNLAVSSRDNEDLKTVKWREKPNCISNDISELLKPMNPVYESMTLPSASAIPDLSFISAKMSGLLLQQRFDKRIFSNIQVIGQLDNKFIVTLCSLEKNSSPHVLGIFDQHAVHERIRLESLMREYSSNNDDWSFLATDLNEPIVMTVSSKEIHMMGSFQNKFEKLGLYFILMEKNNVQVLRIPTCLYKRSLRERSVNWLETTLHILIQDVVQFLIKTSGQDSVVPDVFKDVINSEACKGAIKFGDPLSIVQCEDLLSSLSKCDLPFYCAHGRPSFMPIFDLRLFETERRKFVPE